jgi:hypothetical protein
MFEREKSFQKFVKHETISQNNKLKRPHLKGAAT